MNTDFSATLKSVFSIPDEPSKGMFLQERKHSRQLVTIVGANKQAGQLPEIGNLIFQKPNYNCACWSLDDCGSFSCHLISCFI